MLKTCFTLVISLWLGQVLGAQTVLQNWQGPESRSNFGGTVRGAGDLDGDGTPDVMVGAWNYKFEVGVQGARGFVAIYSGSTGAVIHRYVGTHAKPHAGFVLARGGDVNADGVRDFLFAGTFNCCYGSAMRVHSGKNGNLLYEVQGVWPDSWDFGARLVGDVDLNQDGFDDFVATSPAAGELIAYSGADGGTLYVVSASAGMQGFGFGLDSISDLDGDGVPELALGIQKPGQVDVLSGATGALIYSIAGKGGDDFGGRVNNVGDLDGDQLDDLAVRARELNPGDGRVYLHSGADGALLHELYGSHPGGGFPGWVTGPGDMNADGVPDVAVGASRDSEVFSNGGRVTLFSGADGSVLRVLYGPEAGGNFGTVAGVGDFDGRGVPDLAVGSPWAYPLSNKPGEVSVIAGERSPGIYCTAKRNSQGCTPTIWSSGSPSLAASTFRLSAQSLINEKRGVLLWGLKAARTPFQGGVNCVAGVQGRRAQWSGGNPQASFPEPDCSGSFRDDWSSAFLASAGFVAGQTLYAQFRFSDPADPHGVGLTDAIQFDILP